MLPYRRDSVVDWRFVREKDCIWIYNETGRQRAQVIYIKSKLEVGQEGDLKEPQRKRIRLEESNDANKMHKERLRLAETFGSLKCDISRKIIKLASLPEHTHLPFHMYNISSCVISCIVYVSNV